MQTYFPPVFYKPTKSQVSSDLKRHIKEMFNKYSEDGNTISRKNFKLTCIACFGFYPGEV